MSSSSPKKFLDSAAMNMLDDVLTRLCEQRRVARTSLPAEFLASRLVAAFTTGATNPDALYRMFSRANRYLAVSPEPAILRWESEGGLTPRADTIEPPQTFADVRNS